MSGDLSNVKRTWGPYDELANWESVNQMSPDFYSTLAPLTYQSGPSSTHPSTSTLGAFTPYMNTPGATNGCLGLIGYNDYYNDGSVTYVEYVKGTLKQALSSTHHYYASMWVYAASRAKQASPIGLDITTSAPTTSTYFQTYTPSGCFMQSPNVITGQTWQQVSGVFQGITGAQYIKVGNFQNVPTQNLPGASTAPAQNMSYQYIDNIEVYEIAEAGPNVLTECKNAVTLGRGCNIPGATYTWSAPGVTGLPTNSTSFYVQVTPSQTTVYTLTVTLPGGSSYVSQAKVGVSCDNTQDSIAVAGAVRQNGKEYDLRNGGSVCRFLDVVLTPTLIGNVSNITWTVLNRSSPSEYTSSFNSSTNQLTIRSSVPTSAGSANFQVRVSGTTPTGTAVGSFSFNTTYRSSEYGPVCQDIESADSFTASNNSKVELQRSAYPNPASDLLILPPTTQQATLYNSRGKAVRFFKTAGSLNVQDLPEGLYQLQLLQDDKLTTQRVQVKH